MSECTRKRLTTQAVQKAMEEHDGLVHAFIRRQGGGDIPYEEALQAGRIGLWHAIQGYDPTRGTTFSNRRLIAPGRLDEIGREETTVFLQLQAIVTKFLKM